MDGSLTVMNVDDLKYYKIEYFNRVDQFGIRLNAYNDTIIVPIGLLKVKVKYKDIIKTLNILIILKENLQ